MKKQKLLLVDDHEVVRVGIGLIIEKQPRFEIVAYARDKAEAIEAVKKYSPDIAIVDIRLKGESGIEVCKEITMKYPKTKVLMLTSFVDDDLILKSIKAGACGYLLKQVSNNEILKALHEVADGGCLFDATTATHIVNMMKNFGQEKKTEILREKLNDSEYRILALLGEGKTNNEIAQLVNLSVNTVKNAVSSILKKLEMNNRSEAAIFAAKNNIQYEEK